MGGKGNVVILEGVKGSLTSTDRVRGFNDAIKEFPEVKLLASQPANYQRLQALQVTENLMQSFPQIDGVLAANDAMAIGALEALDGANRKAVVVGINGSREAVELIKSGRLLASGDFNGFVQGCLRRRDRRAQSPQGTDAEGDHLEARRDRQDELPALRSSTRTAAMPQNLGRRDELRPACRMSGQAEPAGPVT